VRGIGNNHPMPPFRFAVQAYAASSRAQWQEMARAAEGDGYSAFHLADHVIGEGPALAATNHPLQTLAAVPAMCFAAEATSTIKVGCRVMCIDYRHPAVLAKEAATIDLLTEGRLELGLGAGWLQGEYEALGIDFDPAPTRIARLAEVLDAITALMTGEQVAIDGEHVRLHGFAGAPVPVQRPHPPIMIGGGSRKVLTLAGAKADIVSFNFDNSSGKIGALGVQSATADRMATKLGWIREGAGARFDQLELEVGAYFTVVTDDAAAAAGGLAQAFGIEPAAVLEHPHALVGSVDAICDELERRRELFGISYVTVGAAAARSFAPVVARLTGR